MDKLTPQPGTLWGDTVLDNEAVVYGYNLAIEEMERNNKNILLERADLIMQYSDEIMKLIDNPPDVPRGDLQGIVEAIVINIVKDAQ